MAQTNGYSESATSSLTNYVAFTDPESGRERIGHLNADNTVQPLAFASGTYIDNLYQVIETQGQVEIIPSGEAIPAGNTRILAPISGRDILCIGKNYAEHATEFHKSGYDSSDKTDQPTHPVFFTKRATSIIANGDDIFPHPGFTESVDYEGELGVIIGKAGFQVSEADAMDYVWGYTIVNDMTARERQRDHKQFFIGKSPDTFCPIGPVAVPKEHLPNVLRVQTHVNGAPRQDATTDTLIFSIPYLIMALSEGQTMQPGDVIATGTPAGVGFGQTPPTFLKEGDEVAVSITGLGTLHNRIASPTSKNSAAVRGVLQSYIEPANWSKSRGIGLTTINNKPLFYQKKGVDGADVVFVHGLGGTHDFYTPLINSLGLDKTHSLHLYDLEGHGLSPTSPLSKLSINSFARDLLGVFNHAGVTGGATLIAHSMGCLVALTFAIANPQLVKKLVLLGPPPSPLPEAASKGSFARADLARSKGMAAVVDAVATAGVSEATKSSNPVAVTAVRLSLLGQDPEGYAKACAALAGATTSLSFESVKAETCIITGDEDKVSPPALCEKYVARLPTANKPTVLKGVGHWHVYEDVQGVAQAVKNFL